MIYPVDNVVQLLDNWGQLFRKCNCDLSVDVNESPRQVINLTPLIWPNFHEPLVTGLQRTTNDEGKNDFY